MKENIKKGKIGEDLAVEYIKKRGFEILETNWRYSRYGEIDIIAKDNKTLVFIEVKTRTSVNFGHPIEAVNRAKIDKMRDLAGFYLSEKNDLKYTNFRFDVIGIILSNDPEITYYKDVYQF